MFHVPRRTIVRVILLAGYVVAPAVAQLPSEAPRAREKLRLTIAFKNTKSVHTDHGEIRRSIRWDGETYAVDDAIDVLMSVAADKDTPEPRRHLALDRLSRLGPSLPGRPCIEELVELYDGLTDELSKCGVLFCLAQSEDPRAFARFRAVIDAQDNVIGRLIAAYGLAQWNERSGVAALISLLDSKVAISDSRMVRDEASIELGRLNRVKGWGFPSREITEILRRADDTSRDKTAAEIASRYRSWFAANKDRFPEWKPGDSLPEVPQDTSDDSGEK